jgi:anti-sigma regulatory factor (Ser/Thr protein kinase)
MTTRDYIDHAGSNFADTDECFADLLAELDWLGAENARLARQALRELRRNLRTYTFGGQQVDIDISATVTAAGVTVILEDSGPEVLGVVRAGRPDPAGSGDHRLRILDQAYDQVIYSRDLGRNRWTLRRFAQPATAAAQLVGVY